MVSMCVKHFMMVIIAVILAGVVLGPRFSKILARTTCVLVSLSEAKNPGQDAILGDSVFKSCELMMIQCI